MASILNQMTRLQIPVCFMKSSLFCGGPLVIAMYVMCCEALHKSPTSKTSVWLETLTKSWVRPRLIGSILLKYTAIYLYKGATFL
jgi:hypothetical protein